jgi:acyl-CoA dehydrogenase
VKERGLWACHLGPHLGGAGYGQLKLALMNELLGRSVSAPVVFGCQAPDSGNAEILAHYGDDDLKKRYLEPLITGDIVSSFSMTEPQGGTDPTQFQTRAILDGGQWVISGEKWFSSLARYAEFLIAMVVTDPDNPPHQRLSALVVPRDAPGLEIVRNVGIWGESEGHGTHAYVRYNDVRVPADHLLGPRGGGFVVAQTRLGGGRIHHAMRTVARVRWAFDRMCERAISRTTTKGESLGRQQLVQAMIADSWIEIEQFRLLVLQTAWKIDRYNDYKRVRADISAVKAAMPKVLHDVAARAVQIHGSLGISEETPFAELVLESFHMGLADGATEIHKVTLARQLLSRYQPSTSLFPSYTLPAVREAARRKFAAAIAEHGTAGAQTGAHTAAQTGTP